MTMQSHNAHNSQPEPTRKEIIGILLNKTTRHSQNFKDIIKCDEPVEVLEANSSVSSIMDWATKA
jgi:hypothetical protein